MVKSGLEFILKLTEPLQRYLLICQANSATETANRAESGQLQFWSKPSEILNLRSSNTLETV